MHDDLPLRILVIEDDPDTRANLADILELDGFVADAVGSFSESLNHDDRDQLLAIILDRKLPDGNAEELLPKIRRAFPDAAIIIVTGYADLDGAITALRHHVADYILKPINPEALRNSIQRIAELRRTADALRQSENKYRCLFENANDLLFIVDPESGKILDANIRAATQLGYHRDQLMSLQIHDICKDDNDGNLDLLLQGKDISHAWVVEKEFVRADGKTFPVEISSTWLHDGGRQVVQCFARDITERKRAAEAIVQERDFADSLIETAQAIVLVLDCDGRIVRFNRFLEELSGYRLEEVRNKNWFETFIAPPDRDRLKEMLRDTLRGLPARGFIQPIVTKSGSSRDIAWWDKMLKNPQGEVTGVLSVGHDVTELRRVQERLLQSERLSAIGQMMAGLAHESRNALQRSQACLELLQRRVGDNPKALELIARIQDAQDHLHQLYEEVRGYAAPIRLDRQHGSLREIWRRAWDHLSAVRRGREASLIEHLTTEPISFVDRYRLEQVFRNLFENSLAACSDPVEIDVSAEELVVDGRPFISIGVHDNGPGLSAEQMERIFEPFFTTKTKGTGLGMAIVQRIVEAHEGRICVDHACSSGTRIVIQLPRGQA